MFGCCRCFRILASSFSLSWYIFCCLVLHLGFIFFTAQGERDKPLGDLYKKGTQKMQHPPDETFSVHRRPIASGLGAFITNLMLYVQISSGKKEQTAAKMQQLQNWTLLSSLGYLFLCLICSV